MHAQPLSWPFCMFIRLAIYLSPFIRLFGFVVNVERKKCFHLEAIIPVAISFCLVLDA